jgi:hypothetical protein
MLCIYDATTSPSPVFRCIGTSPNSLFSYVTNDDTVTITKGQPVYASGGTGDRLKVKRAYNTSDATSAQTIGLVYSDSIAVNQKGIIIMQGLLSNLSILPTSTWSDGSPVYLGATAGTITPTKQYAPNHLVYLGFVTTASNGNAGRLYVKPQNGYELDELHNVQAQSPTNKDTLYFDNTVSPTQWKTASIATILGYTPVATTRTLTINGTGYDLSADRSWTVGSVTSVGGTGTVAGITLTGTVTGAGNLTLGGTLAVPIANITATGTPSSTTYLRGDGTWSTVSTGSSSATIGVTIDGSGGTITTGAKGYVQVPYGCTITSWRIIANASGSIVIDVYKDAAPTIPVTLVTTTGKPTLSTAQTNASSSLGGWSTTTIAANDILGFTVVSATTVSWVILQLFVTKT